MRRLSTRQVHLDFHTSELMQDVGGKFDKQKFQSTLKAGHLNSMTVFAKCHHGYCYYDSLVGTKHPTIKEGFDLVGAMMDACHEIGVHSPIYVTMGWSALDAEEHPEWLACQKDGTIRVANVDLNADSDSTRPFCSWKHLCSAGGYRKHLYDLTEELCVKYKDLDGLFFDIVYMYDSCYCSACKEGMATQGLDVENDEDARKYYHEQKKITIDGIKEILLKHHPEASIFFNSGGAELHKPEWHYVNTHFEMEDLPTVWGGYDKMPIRAKYFSRSGKDYLGMTGKFHRAWGEFGGFKTPEALKYECASLMAYGARISVGDQMHPCGELDIEAYKNIGEAFSYVESIEDYCVDTKETSNIAVMINTNEHVNEGIAKLLLDCHIDFDVIHGKDDFVNFDTVIIPDEYRLNESMGKAVDAFVKNGGNLLILGGGGLTEDGTKFAFDCPFTYEGKSTCDIDYFEATESIQKSIVSSPILCYGKSHKISGKGEILAYLREPYFNRTYETYCSHANTPYKLERAEYPAAIKNGNIIYVAHPLASYYSKLGVTYHRRYFENILRQIYKKQIAKVDIHTSGRICFLDQPKESRYALHLLYATPITRGGVTVIDDLPTIHNTKVTLHLDKPVKKVTLVPQMTEVIFEQDGNDICFVVDEFSCHQLISIAY